MKIYSYNHHDIGASSSLPEDWITYNPGVLNVGFKPEIGKVYKLWPGIYLDKVRKSTIHNTGWECIIENGGFLNTYLANCTPLLVVDRIKCTYGESSKDIWLDTIVLWNEQTYEVGSQNLRDFSWEPPGDGTIKLE